MSAPNILKQKNHASFLAFLLPFIIYLSLGICISYQITFDTNMFFGADNARAFRDWTMISGSHGRISVHPLALLEIQSVILFLNGIVNRMSMTVILAESAFGAGAVCIFYHLLRDRGTDRWTRILFTVIYGFAFSTMVYSCVPENFIFAGFVLISYWYYISYTSSSIKGPLSRTEYFLLTVWGVLSFGVTLTNYFSYLVGLIILLYCRCGRRQAVKSFFAINLMNVLLILVLCQFQNFIWRSAPVFWQTILHGIRNADYEEVKYMNWDVSLAKTANWFRQAFVYPLLSADVYMRDPEAEYHPILFSDFSQRWIWYAALAFLLVSVCAVLQKLVRVTAKKEIRQNAVWLGLLAAYMGNLALHYIYGSGETFIYSPQFLFLPLLLTALSMPALDEGNKGVGIAVRAALGAFCVLEAGNNLTRFFQTANLALNHEGFEIFWIKAIKGTVLCGGLVVLLYLGMLYAKGRAPAAAEVCTAEKRLLFTKRIVLIYLTVAAVTGLFVAFNY